MGNLRHGLFRPDRRVMRHRRLLLSLALIEICLTVGARAQDARALAAKAPPRSEQVVAERSPLLFYLARGEDNACGEGCGEWIAAEGFFGVGSAQRLRTFLKTHSAGKLPIFFHSPGGLQSEALAIGRLMRERQMTAGVAKTVPAGCSITHATTGDSDKACRDVKRTGQKVAAELRAMDGSCNSACVYALIGAKVRQVPPGAGLGVHSSKLVRVSRDGRVKMAAAGQNAQLATFNGQLRDYVRRMGVDAALFDTAAKVAPDQIHRLTRDEIARFGIDDRAFQETQWTVSEKPSQPLAVFKLVAEAKGANHKEFRLSALRLSCASADRIRTLYIRGLASDEVGRTKVLKLAAGNRNWVFPRWRQLASSEAIEAGGSFEALLAETPLEFFESAAAGGRIDIIEQEPPPSTAPPRVISLSAVGLAHAVEVLRQRCGKT